MKRTNLYKGPWGQAWEGPADFIPFGECWTWKNGRWERYYGPDFKIDPELEVEYLRVFINQLRKKIEPDASNPKYILTEPWIGYRFAAHE